jgi:tetratricopeptide (TPR) repeat protein
MDVASIFGLLKDYWFLVTLIISIVMACLYMLIFQVSPWETYRELSERKRVINAHLALGQRLLDHGHYKEAAEEFGHSLQLSPSNLRALECKRKTDLFIALERLEWEPARAVAYRESFLDPEDHNILLFMGKLRERVSDNKDAKSYFERAQTKYKEKNAGDYYDALNSLGWQAYFRHDLKEMITYFTRMRDMGPYDYRGYHGLGYALYMQACQLARDNDSAVLNILNEATELLRDASFYVPLEHFPLRWNHSRSGRGSGRIGVGAWHRGVGRWPTRARPGCARRSCAGAP